MMKILLGITLLQLCISAESKSLPDSARISGGSNAKRGQFPFAASIIYHTVSGKYVCSGTLISNQWVLTAARCMQEAVLFEITLGATNLNTDESSKEEFVTTTHEIHPDFNPDTYTNDVGLLKFHLPLEFTYFISPANLPYQHTTNYTDVYAMGWGETSADNSQNADTLQFVRLTAISNEECKRIYGEADFITDNIVCVAGNNNEGPCRGDLGSPLVEISNGGLVSYIVGVQSFIAGTCESAYPSGYSRIYPYIDWIRTHTGQIA